MEKILLALAIVLMSCFSALAADDGKHSLDKQSGKQPLTTQITLKDAKGEDSGTVKLSQVNQGVLLQINAKGLTPGVHAMHFHEKGDCSPPESFENAGAHLNPSASPHGFMDDHGPHEGDMPNITANADGVAQADIINERVTLDSNDTSKRALLGDADGAALVIHANADDYASQPSGEAGGRVLCAEIPKKAE